jgi:hypothetical protein
MSDKMIQEIKALKSSGLKVVQRGSNVKENIQQDICGADTKYCSPSEQRFRFRNCLK